MTVSLGCGQDGGQMVPKQKPRWDGKFGPCGSMTVSEPLINQLPSCCSAATLSGTQRRRRERRMSCVKNPWPREGGGIQRWDWSKGRVKAGLTSFLILKQIWRSFTLLFSLSFQCLCKLDSPFLKLLPLVSVIRFVWLFLSNVVLLTIIFSEMFSFTALTREVRHGALAHRGWAVEVCTSLATVWRLLQKLKMEFVSDPAIPLTSISPRECKSASLRDICTPVFTAAFLRTAKGQKQSKSPLADEWVMRMWRSHTVEWRPALARTEILPRAVTRLGAEGSERARWNKPGTKAQAYDST